MATTAFTQAPCSPPPKVKKPPACPDCGALECLCRPRFFAGQLLSEQDLNRLDQYIKKKNQLHNRNLHGWGVVNGLKVLCDPCGQVKVSKGYAISPCGDDIVVCEDTAVDICALIRKCKQQDRASIDCQPFSAPGSAGCDDLEEEWVLAIKYAEFPSRGITALRGGGCACGKPAGVCQCQGNTGCGKGGACSCGGSGSCSCGATSGSVVTARPRNAPAECEPSIVCEGYQFDVYRKQEATAPNGRLDDDDDDLVFGGKLAEQFACCIQDLFGSIPEAPSTEPTLDSITANAAAWHQWCCRVREAMIDYFSRYPGTNCEVLRTLHTLVCPNPNTDLFAERFVESLYQLGIILIEGMFNCLCLALLPPAPEAASDQRVPLATVKIRGKDCEIISVCNWTVCRKLVTTWPTMCYWWSVIPIGQLLRNALDKLCCEGFNFADRLFRDEQNSDVNNEIDPATGAANADFAEIRGNTQFETFNGSSGQAKASRRLNPQFNLGRELRSVGKFITASLARADQDVDPASFLKSISRLKLPTEQASLEKIEQRNLPQFLLLNSLAKPLLLSGLQKDKADGGLMSAFMGNNRLFTDSADNDALHNRLADLESKLDQQQRLIDSLQPIKSRNKAAQKPAAKKQPANKVVKKKASAYKAVRKKTTRKATGKKSGKK